MSQMPWKNPQARQGRRGEAGLALALVLLTINVILIVTATLVAIALNEYQAAAGGERSRQAFQLAEAGLEKAIYELKRDPD
jgi:type II secretory pathway component PulK